MTSWHLEKDYLPADGDDIWFILKEDVEENYCFETDFYRQGLLTLVGTYDDSIQCVLLADGTRIKIEDIYQWMTVSDIEMMNYPQDGFTVAVYAKIKGVFSGWALGMYTCRYVDPNTGERHKAVMLDPHYDFAYVDESILPGEDSLVLDWSLVEKYALAPEKTRILRNGINPEDSAVPAINEGECPFVTEDTSKEASTSESGSAILRSKKVESRVGRKRRSTLRERLGLNKSVPILKKEKKRSTAV